MKRLDEQRHEGDRRPYERPTLHSYDEQELLEIVGPAQAYTGVLPGTPGNPL